MNEAAHFKSVCKLKQMAEFFFNGLVLLSWSQPIAQAIKQVLFKNKILHLESEFHFTCSFTFGNSTSLNLLF